MPSYVSHTIMARDVYNKMDKDVSLEYMLIFSLGADLSKYSKCRYDTHHIKQDEFIYNMADYLVDNNLSSDKECLGVLYGHICHYVMDETIHPLVRIVDRNCKRNKKNHTLIEGYYDSYLSKKICHKEINKYNNKELFKSKINKKISKIINYTYEKTYNTSNISRYYKFNIFLYKKIRYLYKLFSLKSLKKISGFNKFINDNKSVDLLNNNRSINYKDSRGNSTHDNLDQVYKKSIEEAISYINKINKYMEEKTRK